MKQLLAVGVLVLIAVTAGCNVQTGLQSESVVRAQRFELLNAQGEVVGVLADSPEGPGLQLYGADGKQRIAVALNETGPAVTLFAADATPKVILNLGNDGHPGLSLIDSAGKTRYDLRLRQDERPCMLFWDVAAPKPRMGFGINPAGNPNAVLFDADGNRRLWVHLLADEGPSVGVGTANETVWSTPAAK